MNNATTQEIVLKDGCFYVKNTMYSAIAEQSRILKEMAKAGSTLVKSPVFRSKTSIIHDGRSGGIETYVPVYVSTGYNNAGNTEVSCFIRISHFPVIGDWISNLKKELASSMGYPLTPGMEAITARSKVLINVMDGEDFDEHKRLHAAIPLPFPTYIVMSYVEPPVYRDSHPPAVVFFIFSAVGGKDPVTGLPINFHTEQGKKLFYECLRFRQKDPPTVLVTPPFNNISQGLGDLCLGGHIHDLCAKTHKLTVGQAIHKLGLKTVVDVVLESFYTTPVSYDWRHGKHSIISCLDENTLEPAAHTLIPEYGWDLYALSSVRQILSNARVLQALNT